MGEFAGRHRRWALFVGGLALGVAVMLGLGGSVTPLVADDAKPAEKAPPAESKPKFKPEDVQIGAPPELEALRKAVENAGKKGENVEEIRKHLEALEKALTGRAWVRPQAQPEIVRPGQPAQQAERRPRNFVMPRFPELFQPMPNFPAFDGEAFRKAQELMEKALENFQANPEDPEALQKLLQEQQKMIRQAMGGIGGRLGGIGAWPFPGLGIPVRGEGRLGVHLDQVPAALADQLELPAGRGLLVVEVVPGSAAEKAGVKPSDIIVEFAGQVVTDDAQELVRRVNEAKSGEKIELTVLRKGKKVMMQVELPERKKPAERRADFVPGFPGIFGGIGGAGFGGFAPGSSIRFSVVNGQFDLQSDDGQTSYAIKGHLDAGRAVPTEIAITEDGNTTTYESLDKVPNDHREKVERLLSNISVGGRKKPQNID